ncbi:hypothetical protein BJX63DRAFT_432961 [Aspergillus granulosus]|uniref:F-box domain-containing protein n=1 Tax=Aspergillus granulosus TaxID=176169 RepID=A0ABR4H930_9EURO
MKTLSALPIEIISLILQSCDGFSQLRSMLLVCRRLCSVFLQHQSTILWHVGQAEILGFSDALIAVRATEIARQALEKGELPPDPFPVSELSGESRKPSFEELEHIRKLESLAHWHEEYIRPEAEITMPDQYDRVEKEWARHKWDVWRDGHRRALYRYLAAGPILYRAYHTPLLSKSRPRGFLAAFIRMMELDSDEPVYDWFSASDRSFYSKAPLFGGMAIGHTGVMESPVLYAGLGLPGLASQTLGDESSYFGFQYMAPLLDRAWESIGLPNSYQSNKKPPYCIFNSAEYMFRKYFGLRFADNCFDDDTARYLPWERFACYVSVFTNREHFTDIGHEMFQSCDDSPPAAFFTDHNA